MPEVIDLDKIRAARREAQGESPVVKFGGREFTLPAEMPFAVIEAIGALATEEGQEVDGNAVAEGMADIARALFGKDYRAFLDLGPSTDDLMALMGAVAPLYGGGAEAAVAAVTEPTA